MYIRCYVVNKQVFKSELEVQNHLFAHSKKSLKHYQTALLRTLQGDEGTSL